MSDSKTPAKPDTAADAKAAAEDRAAAEKANAEAREMLEEAKAHRVAAERASETDPTVPVVIAGFRCMKGPGTEAHDFVPGERITKALYEKFFADRETFNRRVANKFISTGGVTVE